MSDELTMPESEIRAKILAGDPAGLRALRAQVDDFVDNDPFLVDIGRQLRRGDGPGCLTMHGSATWAPVRGAGDWSEWGAWEAWEECTIGPCNNGTAVGPIPTGAWLVWDSASGQTFGLPGKDNQRKKAEMMALTLNKGQRTRVVPHGADAVASDIDFAKLAAKVGAEMARLEG